VAPPPMSVIFPMGNHDDEYEDEQKGKEGGYFE
jgi:hypothetical protein